MISVNCLILEDITFTLNSLFKGRNLICLYQPLNRKLPLPPGVEAAFEGAKRLLKNLLRALESGRPREEDRRERKGEGEA